MKKLAINIAATIFVIFTEIGISLLIFLFLYYWSPVLFWIVMVLFIVVNALFVVFAVNSARAQEQKNSLKDAIEEPVKFNHIKMITTTGKIKVFSKWGNFLCYITEEEGIINISKEIHKQDEYNEIVFVNNNYLLIYNQLKEHENGTI